MFRARKFQLRRKGNRPDGEQFTGENPNKGIDMTTPDLQVEDIRPEAPKKKAAKKTAKKKPILDKVKKAITG